MEIRRLDHVALLVKDVERSRRFYVQLLGVGEHPSRAILISLVPGSVKGALRYI